MCGPCVKGLVCLMEAHSFLCEVRTERVMYIDVILKKVIGLFETLYFSLIILKLIGQKI